MLRIVSDFHMWQLSELILSTLIFSRIKSLQFKLLHFNAKGKLSDSLEVKVQLWDMADSSVHSQEWNKMYIKGANGVIFVYDMNDRYSFSWLEGNRFQKSFSNIPKEAKVMLLGNKSDLEQNVDSAVWLWHT